MCIGTNVEAYNRPSYNQPKISPKEAGPTVAFAALTSVALITIGTLALIGLSSPTSSLGFLGSAMGTTGASVALMAGTVPILAALLSAGLRAGDVKLPTQIVSCVAGLAATALIGLGIAGLVLGSHTLGCAAITAGVLPLVFVASKHYSEAKFGAMQNIFKIKPRDRVITAVALALAAIATTVGALAIAGYIPLSPAASHLTCAGGVIALLSFLLPARTEIAHRNEDETHKPRFKHAANLMTLFAGVTTVALIVLGTTSLTTFNFLGTWGGYATLAAGVVPLLIAGTHAFSRYYTAQAFYEETVWGHISVR